jgi:uncharacterized protein
MARKKKTRLTRKTKQKRKSFFAILGIISIPLLLLVILIMMPDSTKTEKPTVTERWGEKDDDTSARPSDERSAPMDEKNDRLISKNTFPQNHTERPEQNKGSISIVIDDVGNSLEELAPFLKLPGRIAFAILPGLPYSREAARLVHEAGKDVILHLPMEAVGENPLGPGSITVSDGPDAVRETIDRDLLTVPGAIGINNHMGSKATADMGTMSSVFSALQGKGLFFLDSKTTAQSTASELGALFDVEVMERNIFLDNEPEAESIRIQIEKGLRIAEDKGACVFIGHVQNRVLSDILTEMLPLIEKKSYTLITLNKLRGVCKR